MRDYSYTKNVRKTFGFSRKKNYERIKYENCRCYLCVWIDCSWSECDFYRVGFFWNCVFKNCSFSDQYTYLGANFKRCRFIDCDFEDVSFKRAVLSDCVITGTLTNIVFYGKQAPSGWQTRFNRVDLSGAKLIDTDFRLGLKMEEIIT